MTNPLLQPDDRFKRPQFRSSDGQNLFGDGAAEPLPAVPQDQAGNIFAAPASSGEQTKVYAPVYVQTMSHRGNLLLSLAGLGLGGTACMLAAITGWLPGWVFAMIGIVPALICAYLALEDQKAIRAGAMDPAGETPTTLALWGALGSIVASLGLFVAMVVWVLSSIWELFSF
jgi:hypothetical protein